MHEFNQIGGKPDKRAGRFATLLVVAVAAAGGIALAQAQRSGGPTPSGQGAEVYFIDLRDGATVPEFGSSPSVDRYRASTAR
jgi:hypothetical protein